MRSFLTIVFLSLFILHISACKKKDNPPAIALNLSVQDDEAHLSWTVSGDISNLNHYTIYEITDPNNDGGNILSTTTETSAIVKLPVSPYIAYRVSVTYDNSLPGSVKQQVFSEYKTYSRDEIKLVDLNPMDVLHDGNTLYMFEGNGSVVKYDIPSAQITKQVKVGNSIRYPDLAEHNGQKEIYVPDTDGNISILNTDLEVKDVIVAGEGVYSVVYGNGYLYTTVKAPGSKQKGDYDPTNYMLYVFNRTTKQLVNNSNNNVTDAPQRIKKVPGTATEFFGIVSNAGETVLSFYQLYHYTYSASGDFISNKKGYADFVVAPLLMDIYPDGNTLISGIRGRKYNKNLELTGSFSDSEVEETYVSGFGVNSLENRIYIGRHDRTIDVVNPADNSIQRTIKTIGYPYRIFYNSGNIISVSRQIYPQSISTNGTLFPSKCIVEVFQ